MLSIVHGLLSVVPKYELEGAKVLENRWVNRVKRDQSGAIDTFKARLVIKGFKQEHGIDFEGKFAPVCRYESIRLL